MRINCLSCLRGRIVYNTIDSLVRQQRLEHVKFVVENSLEQWLVSGSKEISNRRRNISTVAVFLSSRSLLSSSVIVLHPGTALPAANYIQSCTITCRAEARPRRGTVTYLCENSSAEARADWQSVVTENSQCI